MTFSHIPKSATNLDLGPRESSRDSTIANGFVLLILSRLRSLNLGALARSKFQVCGRFWYTCGGENCLQFQKSQILRERNIKLNGNRSFHTGYSTENNSFKTTFEERRFLPGLKAWVSALSKG